jgi:hypothetical protein
VMAGSRVFQEPVFVDDSGKRRRWIRIAFTVIGVGAFTYAALLGWSIMGGPLGPASMIPFPDALNKPAAARTSAPAVAPTAGPSVSRTTAPASPKSVSRTSPAAARPAAPVSTPPSVAATPTPVTTTPAPTRHPRTPEGTLLPSDPSPSHLVPSR